MALFAGWTWSDERSGARAREALLGVCAVSAVVVVSLCARLASLGRRRGRGTAEAGRRARALAAARRGG